MTYIIVTVFQIVFTDIARKQYGALSSRLRRQVDKGLDRIAKQPYSGKPLRGQLRGIWSERVSTFRVLYKIKNEEIEVLVLTIEHRKSVYGGH